MKKAVYFICYLLAILVGICLLIFNHEASATDQTTLHYVFIALGVVFILPGIFILLASMHQKKDENGNIIRKPIASTITGIISLVWGVLILIMPSGIFGSLNITLGISLIIISLAQIVWIAKGKTKNSTPFWLFIIPILVIAAGVAVILLKKDFQDPGKEMEIGCIISGIVLLFWGMNGFMSLPNRTKTVADIEADKKKLEHDTKKVLESEKRDDKNATEKISQSEKHNSSSEKKDSAQDISSAK